ncbi:hypothetical protein LTR51_008626 [Lithohypha guttulata]|nr:hypothetical protein LTR51_008626 [Lithohypha guttulata]
MGGNVYCRGSAAVAVLCIDELLERPLGVWQGKLFFAPGLQGSLEREEIAKRQVDPEMASVRNHNPYGLAFQGTKEGEYVHRKATSDGSYKKGKLEDEPKDA